MDFMGVLDDFEDMLDPNSEGFDDEPEEGAAEVEVVIGGAEAV